MLITVQKFSASIVALRKESVDRNNKDATKKALGAMVALRKESVDRNANQTKEVNIMNWSLSARRAWIEIPCCCWQGRARQRRSPQGERG